MVKVKSDREEIIARAKADVEARKKYKENILKKIAEKFPKKKMEPIKETEFKEMSRKE